MQLRRLLQFLSFGIFCVAAATASDHASVQDKIKEAINGKIFILRGFYTGHRIQFDTKGDVVNNPPHGLWSTDGYFRVKSVRVKDGAVEIKATRLAVAFTQPTTRDLDMQAKCKPEWIPEMRSFATSDLALTLVRDQGSDVTEFGTVWRKIVLREHDLPAEVPALWKPFVRLLQMSRTEREEYQNQKIAECTERLANSKDPNRKTDLASRKPIKTLPDGEPVYALPSGAKPPKAIDTTDPDYNEIARRARFSGTCVFAAAVDKNGVLREIEVQRPCGLGLDEVAQQTLRKWTFRPATFEGKPIAIQILVDLQFHLD